MRPRFLLPAYAHNDYANPRPLYQALELGFRGVEADVPVTFLLNIELKERSREGFDSLVAAIERYRDLVDQRDADGIPPVEIVLVGWHPPTEEIAPGAFRLFRLQQHVTSGKPDEQSVGGASVRLVSLDYGKTIAWAGRGPLPASTSTWLARVRAAKERGAGGIDLLGPKQPRASQAVLTAMNDETREGP